MNKLLGAVLVAVGVIGLAWGGFSYTSRRKVADIGPIHATRDKTQYVPLPPLLGAGAFIGGIALLLSDGRK
jgi:hypothetical protein